MFLHPAYRILAAVLSLVALCSASGSNDTSNNALWNGIPDCAMTCLGYFIEGQYGSGECSYGLDIKCLCRTKTSIGLTLGEAALSCLYALCAEKDIASKGNSVYHVCDPVSGAIPETHATITATTFDPPSLTSTTADAASITSQSTSQTKSYSSTSKFPASTTSGSSTGDSTITFLSTSSSSGVRLAITSTESTSTARSGTTTSSASSDGSPKNHVSSSTVIGVSVASLVVGSFIIGVAVFFCCKRWKQSNHRIGSDSDHDFFEIGGAMSQPPGFSRPSSRHPSRSSDPNPTGPSLGHAAGYREVSELPCAQTPVSQNSLYTATVMLVPNTKKEQKQEPVGIAVSSEDDWETSTRTRSSQNTLTEPMTSHNAGLYPKPLRWSHRPASGETLFEEDEFQKPQTRISNGSKKSELRYKMTGLPANPRALKNGFPAQNYLRTPQQRPHTSQNPSPLQSQAVHNQGTLAPAFSTTALRGSPPSNPSSARHNSSASSHSNSANTLLTPPSSTEQGRSLSDMSPGNPRFAQTPTPRLSPSQAKNPAGGRAPVPGQGPGSATPSPPFNGLGLSQATEIISRPRIVRRDDIKRVQIRSSPRPPSEVVAPYCPEDFWLERGRSRTPAPTTLGPGGLPYPSEASPGTVLFPRSPQRRPQDVDSKRGQDLILRVD